MLSADNLNLQAVRTQIRPDKRLGINWIQSDSHSDGISERSILKKYQQTTKNFPACKELRNGFQRGTSATVAVVQ